MAWTATGINNGHRRSVRKHEVKPYLPKIKSISCLLVLVLTGCLGPSDGQVDAPEQIVLQMGNEASAIYRVAPSWPTQVPLTMHWTFTGESGQRKANLWYEYADKPDWDVTYAMDLDDHGRIQAARVPCIAPYPDQRAKGCIDQLSGGIWPDGSSAPLFDMPLIEGATLDGPWIEVGVPVGTAQALVRLPVEDLGDRHFSIGPPAERIPLVPWFRVPGPFNDCSILTGTVVYDAGRGLPVSCTIEEDDGDRFGWQLVDTQSPVGRWNLTPLQPHATPTGEPSFPSPSNEESVFPLAEAIDQALQVDGFAEVAGQEGSFLCVARMLAISTLSLGGTVESRDYEWMLSAQAGTDVHSVKVTKTLWTEPVPSNYSVTDEGRRQEDAYQEFPAAVVDPGTIASRVNELLGIKDSKPQLFRFDIPSDNNLRYEPATNVYFAPEQVAGWRPFASFDATGHLRAWLYADHAPPPDW